jgi:ATP-binding cassette subfamily F protein 3
MREALAQALVDFEGALIVVAHDRHLLSAATDQWMLVADGRLAPFEGDLDDYKEWVKQRQVGGGRGEAGGKDRNVSRKEEKRIEAEVRQRESQARKPFEKRIAAIEAELAPLQEEATATDAWLASAEAYEEANRERMQAALKRQAEIRARIAALEDDWLWTQAQMEAEVNRARG